MMARGKRTATVNERKPICQYKAGGEEQVDPRTLNKMEAALG
jgi:hypothetical protein